MSISDLAIIENGAQIGKNVTVEPYAFIGKDVILGDDNHVMYGAHISHRTTIGKGNTIHQYAILGDVPQDLKYQGEDTELIIGDNNKIRTSAEISIGTNLGNAKTVVGNGNLIMGKVHIGHDCVIGNSCVISQASVLAGHVNIGNHAVVGGMAAIHQFCTIGDYAMVGGFSGLGMDVPHFCIYGGNRSSISGLNLIGLKRAGFSREDISDLKSAYKSLSTNESTLNDVINQLLSTTQNSLVKSFLEFILNSKRRASFKKGED